MRRLSVMVALLLPFAGLHAQAGWTVDRKPILDVPGVSPSGGVNFENAAGVTRLRDGSLLIADRGPNSIRLIDAAGKLVKTSGRTGDGPGEFQTMIWAGGCGPDSLLVWDLRKGQASMVGPTGSVARQFKIPSDSGTRVRRPLNVIACGKLGTIAYISDPTGRVAGASPDIMSMLASEVTINRDGKILGHVDSLPSGEMFATISPSGGHGAFPRPLGIAASVAVIGDRTIIGLSDSARVLIVDPTGQRTTVRLPLQTRPPSRDEFDASVASIVSMAPASMRQSATDQLSKAPLPSFAPAYSGLFSDPSGLLWVQVSPIGAKQSTLLVTQPDGRVVARVVLPMSMAVSEIGQDYILGTYSDANDEIHIAVLRLTRK